MKQKIEAKKIRQSHKDDGERVETGGLQINNDWTGLFIRGDDAAGLRMYINSALPSLEKSNDENVKLLTDQLKSLAELIEKEVIEK